MTDKQHENSYERYKQWQRNKIRYQYECGAYAIIFVLTLFFLFSHFKEVSFIIVVLSCYFLINSLRKIYRTKQAMNDIKKWQLVWVLQLNKHRMEGFYFQCQKKRHQMFLINLKEWL